MLKTIVQKGAYHDSVVLMLLTNQISQLDGVQKVSIMMGTPSNKEMYREAGLATEELKAAGASDMVIVADVNDENIMQEITQEAERFFQKQANASAGKKEDEQVRSWDKALEKMPQANLAVLSIPGAYAALEAERALNQGINVFMFSDNVSIEDELRLKKLAHEKGLALMGPDCGTGIIQGAPIAFTNHVAKGSIGIIGASGTGIQEVSSLIDQKGEGVKNAIGIGGRDLSEEVGGITMLDMIEVMEQDDDIKVLLIVSKPPAKSVKEKIENRLRCMTKPVVTLFLGEKPPCHEEGFYHAYTLAEAADLAVSLAQNKPVEAQQMKTDSIAAFSESDNKTIKAYYSGGTLAAEAAMLIKESLGIAAKSAKKEGFMLNTNGHIVVDLGDDVYTQGRPHPMIDPKKRIECMEQALEDEDTGVILFDIMLGYGSHEDMAGALLPAIEALKEKARQAKRNVHFVATVCGTKKDPQGYDNTVQKLQMAGVHVCENNYLATQTALYCIGKTLHFEDKDICPKQAGTKGNNTASQALQQLLFEPMHIINIGLAGFAEVLKKFDCDVLQYDWSPPANGNIELIKALEFLRATEKVNLKEANQKVLTKMLAAKPVITDVVPAQDVIPILREKKTILHAGPPIEYKQMPDPVQGSCVGALLFEGWAKTEQEAREQLSRGDICFIPCHEVNAVGPMGGITTANMPVFVVKNEEEGNEAYCTMNEGIGKVLRFGAYSQEVVDRLVWMKEVLGPTLSKALQCFENGISVNPLVAKAIAMGDEFHQRNIAASLSFFKEVAPHIAGLPIDEKDRQEVIRFLAETEQFFLNIMMATSKAIMDAARTLKEGSVVTAMCRNGVNFGIRISGMGDEWFTAPVNTPSGLYFTGYDGEDACTDIGDSAITETVGVGGVAMIAAPAVTRFVGAGGYEDALNTSNEMCEIYIDHNPAWIIPNWNFKGSCLGLDAALVTEKQITPVINTGIAHKVAGFGQIGAGTVRPPVACFEKAVLAYAKKLGFSL